MNRLPDYELLTPAQEKSLCRTMEAGLIAAAVLAGHWECRIEVSRPELRALAMAGRDAEHRFLCANLRLVRAISHRAAAASTLSKEDLFQEGFLGLVEATHRFDYRRGVRFATYAYPWIQAKVTEALGGNYQFRLSTRQMMRMRDAGRTGEPDGAPVRVVSLDEVGERVGVDPDRDRQFAQAEGASVAWDEVMADLAPVQRRVIEMRYGFAGPTATYDQAARRLGLSASTVRRIDLQIRALLRSRLQRKGIDSSDGVRTGGAMKVA